MTTLPQQCIKFAQQQQQQKEQLQQRQTTTDNTLQLDVATSCSAYNLTFPHMAPAVHCFTPYGSNKKNNQKKVALKWSSSNDMQTFGPAHTI